jgi:glycosyl transferase family 25
MESREPVEPPYIGYYINLDRSTARRAKMEEQLRTLALDTAYTRFPAVDGRSLGVPKGPFSPGEIGCFASHAKLLNAAAAMQQHIHVMEDDVVLSAQMMRTLADFIAQGVMEKVDVIFTDVFVPIDPTHLALYQRVCRTNCGPDREPGREKVHSVGLLDLKGKVWACTSSYLVGQRSVARIAHLLDDEARSGPRSPIDIALRTLVESGEIKAACTMPFLTSIELASALESTVRGEEDALSRLACNIVRHALFVRPDWELITRTVDRYFPPEPANPRLDTIRRMMDFRISGKYKSF